jgi:hypothetical protein
VKLSCFIRAFYSFFGYGFYPVVSYDAEYEPRQKGKDLNRLGCRLSAVPTLKFAFGRLVAADSLACTWIDMAGLGPSIPEDFYVEPVSNAVMKLRDCSLTNDAFLMYKAGELIFTRTDRALLVGINHYFFTVSRSGYTSTRISLAGLFTAPLRKRIDLTSVLVIGVFLNDRYYSLDEGKIYAAAQAAIDVRL